MIDASAKSLDGLLDGSYFFLGEYDECLAIRYSIDSKEQQAQYSLLQMFPFQNRLESNQSDNSAKQQLNKLFLDPMFQLRVGVCLPSECNSDDVRQLFNPGRC